MGSCHITTAMAVVSKQASCIKENSADVMGLTEFTSSVHKVIESL